MVKGELPLGPRQKDFKDRDHHGVGLYDAAGARYMTLTGCRIGGNGVIAERTAELQRIHARLFPPKPKTNTKEPHASMPDHDLIARACKANDSGKFSRLWNGQWEGDYASQSEADLALCVKLSFWTNRDATRIDALFRRSGLMRAKWNRTDYRELTIAKAVERTTDTWKGEPRSSAASPAVIDLAQFEPSLELLNGMAVFGGQIRFRSVRRRGPMIIATPAKGQEIIWYSVADLTSFNKSQGIIADATHELIFTPSKAKVRALWEPAARLLLQLAERDKELSEPPLKDEFRELLRSVWERAGEPTIRHDDEHADELFVDLLRKCTTHARDPHAEPPSCCVWLADGFSWVHLPSLLDWLSCPVAKSKHFDWSEARKALLLLGFTYIKDCHRFAVKANGDAIQGKASVWRAPESLLKD